jgi:biopolymer transport protein ExbB
MELFANVFSVLQKGGFVMCPLLLCSIIVVAIAFERFQLYGRAQSDVDGLLAELAPKLGKCDRQGMLEVCHNERGLAAAILAEGLKYSYNNSHSLENVLSGAASLAVADLRERLGFLDTIVTLAPLLGLLGTVIGMISSFSIMNVRTGQPLAITGGVGEALVATATGLCVAVLALVVHSYFVQRLDTIVTGIEKCCTFLLDAFNRGEHNETA